MLLEALDKPQHSRQATTTNDTRVLLIERTKSRSIANFPVLRKALEQRYSVTLFSDAPGEPTRSQAAILSMFRTASVIVAPHGAGLANMVTNQ